MTRAGRTMWVVAVAGTLVAAAAGPAGAAGGTQRVSVSSAGAQANDDSGAASISADGRYVAFESPASNLVPGDTNGRSDVYVRDRRTNTTGRVSVSGRSDQADGASDTPSISADGRYVAFDSDASNLVPGDTNGTWDVFVRDRQAGTTERVDVSSTGAQANEPVFDSVVSANGRYVAFTSWASNLVPGDTNNALDVFVRDRRSRTTERVSVSGTGTQADDQSVRTAISANGRYVVFNSFATNLVPGDTNGTWDEFVRDRQSRTTERVSVSGSGGQANSRSFDGVVSADGRYVAFDSFASNLVPGDTNGWWDVFVRDRRSGTTQRVNVSSTGAQANDSNGLSAMSPDGRYVAFLSAASNLVPGDTNAKTDVYVRDRQAGTTGRASVSSTGAQANDDSHGAAISADGRYVAFPSDASNLVPGDTNRRRDVFVRDRG
jgi:archaellum component FlaF (FlaF/FlaG flagellin family)